MDKRDFTDIGKEIRDAVQQAVNSMDFADLNRQITESVNDALEEIQTAFQAGTQADSPRHQAEREQERARREARMRAEREARRAREAAARRAERASDARSTQADSTKGQEARARERARQVKEELKRRRDQVIARRPKGRVSNVLYTVFGSVCLGVGVLTGLLTAGIAAGTGALTGAALGLFICLAVPFVSAGIWMLGRGAAHRGRLERFQSYVNCIGERSYVKVSDLAASVHKSEKYTVRDLKKMVELQMFPQGHISEQGNLFILDHETYRQYESMQREVAAQARARSEETPEKQALRETVERGQDYLKAIRKANEAIPGEEITQKLNRLEHAVSRIYEQIKKQPEKLSELRRFQEYYLPTTLKLVETYREFDAQPIAGENITTAKAEIEASLDTINQAFEKLFDSLFADAAMDISTDISVLHTLLAQEGLTQDGFRQGNSESGSSKPVSGGPGSSEQGTAGMRSH